jgi:hypothetical protein
MLLWQLYWKQGQKCRHHIVNENRANNRAPHVCCTYLLHLNNVNSGLLTPYSVLQAKTCCKYQFVTGKPGIQYLQMV